MLAFEAIPRSLEAKPFIALRDFCTRIGEGELHPKKIELYFKLLKHPVIDGEILITYDKAEGIIYFSEAPIGGEVMDYLKSKPFYHITEDGPIFPAIVTLYPTSVACVYSLDNSKDVSDVAAEFLRVVWFEHWQYRLLKGLFTQDNPYPWIERESHSTSSA